MTRQLIAVPEILVASKAYLAAHGAPEQPAALCDHRLLSWSPPREASDRWVMAGGGTLDVAPAIVSSDIHLIRQLACAGLGIARVLEGGLLEDTDLVRLLPEAFSRSVPFRFLIPEGLHRTPRMRLVVQLLEQMGLGVELGLRKQDAAARSAGTAPL